MPLASQAKCSPRGLLQVAAGGSEKSIHKGRREGRRGERTRQRNGQKEESDETSNRKSKASKKGWIRTSQRAVEWKPRNSDG